MSHDGTSEPRLTHIVGTFLIQAEGAFLNGAGIGQGEYRNVTVPKTLTDLQDKVPYVSSQAWKRWLRNTFQEEFPRENHSVLKALKLNAKGNPEKIGTEMDPVIYPEDDIFGYMRAQQGQGRVAKEENQGLLDAIELDDETGATTAADSHKGTRGERVQSVMRPSPFSASILLSIRKSGWQGLDEGYVHLKEGTPLPYSTQFYNTQLQGIFGLDYSRLGVFRNEGDRVEIDPALVKKHIGSKLDKQEDRNIYFLSESNRRDRATMILRSLAVMRKAAKEAQFATDVAPKVLIVAGLTSGNLIFNDLFEDTKDGPKLKIQMLKEVIGDYSERLVTPVYVGIRTGYLSKDNEAAIRATFTSIGTGDSHTEQAQGAMPVVEVVTPIQAIERLVERLPK